MVKQVSHANISQESAKLHRATREKPETCFEQKWDNGSSDVVSCEGVSSTTANSMTTI